MKRNSTTIFLESPGATTPLPWVNNAPDFTGYTDPTLTVLTNSWQAFLDSGEELEIIPDPEPIPETPEPEWTAFNTAMLSNTYWQNWAIHSDLRTALISSSVNAKADSFQASYDLAKSILPPSAEAIAEWQVLADTYHIPLVL